MAGETFETVSISYIKWRPEPLLRPASPAYSRSQRRFSAAAPSVPAWISARIALAESREILTVCATFVAGRLSAKSNMAVSVFDAGMRAPVTRRSRMDLEATAVKRGVGRDSNSRPFEEIAP